MKVSEIAVTLKVSRVNGDVRRYEIGDHLVIKCVSLKTDEEREFDGVLTGFSSKHIRLTSMNGTDTMIPLENIAEVLD